MIKEGFSKDDYAGVVDTRSRITSGKKYDALIYF